MRRKSKRLFLLIFCSLQILCAGQKNSQLLDSILRTTALMSKVAASKSVYQPQIIYTQINRDEKGKPLLKNFYFNVDSNRYFYCASLVKLPTSIFALEKMNNLKIPGLNRGIPMLTDSTAPCQVNVYKDTTSENGLPSLEHYIKKMLLVSDNFGFSRTFEFVGPSHLNNRMAQIGFPMARIIHRFDVSCVGRGNKYFNAVRFVDMNGRHFYSQPADSLWKEYDQPIPKMLVGRDLLNKRKRVISSRKDFSRANYLSLKMIHTVLRDLVFMDTTVKERKFGITQSDRLFLLKHMGMYPRESVFPKYPPDPYYDSFKKYFIYGATTQKIEVDSVRIFNIVGRAYGYVADCAYIINYTKGIEFLLSAVIYTNARNSFGSGTYEYDNIGLPFLKELSLALYGLENNRKVKRLPDLSPLNFYQKEK